MPTSSLLPTNEVFRTAADVLGASVAATAQRTPCTTIPCGSAATIVGYRDECYAITITYSVLLAWSLHRRATTPYEEESDCLLACGVACRRQNTLRALCAQAHP